MNPQSVKEVQKTNAKQQNGSLMEGENRTILRLLQWKQVKWTTQAWDVRHTEEENILYVNQSTGRLSSIPPSLVTCLINVSQATKAF